MQLAAHSAHDTQHGTAAAAEVARGGAGRCGGAQSCIRDLQETLTAVARHAAADRRHAAPTSAAPSQPQSATSSETPSQSQPSVSSTTAPQPTLEEIKKNKSLEQP